MSAEFVDTNILLYAHDTSAGEKRRRAVELAPRLGRSGSGCIRVQVLIELAAALTKKTARPLTLSAAAEITGDLSTWDFHEPRAADVGAALRIADRYGLSIRYAMIVHAPVWMEATVVWTEDLSHGQIYAGVPARNPFQDD